MAQGDARAAGRPGVVFATSGPGATNLVTPIADAQMDSTPLVCITGQVARRLIGTNAFQECDIVKVVAPLVKGAWQVLDPDSVAEVVAEAVDLACSGRPGPTLVDIPRDVQEAASPAPGAVVQPIIGRSNPQRELEAVRAELARSRRPLLYVGGGVVNADATMALRELAEMLQVPAVTTLMAKGALPEDHSLFAGIPGMHGHVWANRAIGQCDLLMAIGARFDDRVTGDLATFAPHARVVHFDVDARELGKLRRPDVAVAGSVAQTLPALNAVVRSLGVLDIEPWRDQIRRWRQRHPLQFDRQARTLKPQEVVEILDEALAGRDTIWTTGVGQHQMWAMQYVRCRQPRSFITSGGHGTMGFGVPAAIGAKAARPDATVVCIDGDGSFQMTMQEIATSVAEDLPIIVVIVNNGHLGMVQQWQTMYFDRRLSHVDLTRTLPDYAGLARSLGAHAATVTSGEQLRAAVEAATAADRTTVIDARVDRFEQCYPMIPPGAPALDMVEWPGRQE
jgi:acetolactate synthase-1/2/3 large subunit